MTARDRHPEVLYLPAIFRAIRQGNVRIPAFQRGYVWEKSKGIELLDSVRNGYPIGSLLFWEADVSQMTTDDGQDVPLPHPPIKGAVDFVLDGMQRLSTLYGAFHSRDGVARERDLFAVSYDLDAEEFVPVRDENETCIDLRRLFVPRDLLNEQARLGDLANGELYVSRTIELHRMFQEYLVPIIRIGSHDASEAVKIFERINSTGTRLSAVDFMRALTWHRNFDLTARLDSVAENLSRLGWEIPQTAIAKCIALMLNVVPKSDEMIKLRNVAPKTLQKATHEVEGAIRRVIGFLETGVGIQSFDYVPYEAQFLVLAGLALDLDSDADFPAWARGWFWATGFSEWFFGKPDTNIAQLVRSVREDPSVRPHVHERLTSGTVMRRVQKKGGAVAMAMAAGLAQNAHSIVSGERIPPNTLVDEYRSARIGAIFDRDELVPWYGAIPRSDKFVANSVWLSEEDERSFSTSSELRRAIVALAKRRDGKQALATQGIDASTVKAIQADDVSGFMKARSSALVRIAESLMAAG